MKGKLGRVNQARDLLLAEYLGQVQNLLRIFLATAAVCRKLSRVSFRLFGGARRLIPKYFGKL